MKERERDGGREGGKKKAAGRGGGGVEAHKRGCGTRYMGTLNDSVLLCVCVCVCVCGGGGVTVHDCAACPSGCA